MEFRVLGSLCVRHDGEMVDLGGPRQRAVLAALLLRANQQVGIAALGDAVWESPPASPASNLRTYAAGLRKRFRDTGGFDDRLISRNGSYTLVVRPGELDLLRFDALVDSGERALHLGSPKAAAVEFERALGLWRGHPLEDCAMGRAMRVETALLEDRRLALLERLATVRIELGESASVVDELRRVLVEHPFREELWAHLMVALCRCGRRADALASFGAARRRLVEELGIEPGPRLCALQQRILAGDPVPSARAVPERTP